MESITSTMEEIKRLSDDILTDATTGEAPTALQNITNLIELLHKTDDYYMALEKQVCADDKKTLEMIKFYLDGGLLCGRTLLKKIYDRAWCPECSAPVVNGVCQSATCKGRLL